MSKEGARQRSDRDLAISKAELEAEQEIAKRETDVQAERERMIAQSYEMAGQIKAVKMITKFGDVTSLMWLKQVKESKIYRDLPTIGTWENYCKYLGLDRHTVDQDLLNLATFGEQFLAVVTNLQVGYRDLRKLRQLTHEGAVTVEAEAIKIGEETIPFNEDHADELQAAIEKILDDKKQLDERVAKLQKGVDAVVKEETKGLQAEKKAFIARIKELEKYEPKEMDDDVFAEQFEEIHKTTAALATQIGKLVIIDDLEKNPHLAAKVEGFVASAEMLINGLRQQWQEKFNLFGA